jgi:hypothetical protein
MPSPASAPGERELPLEAVVETPVPVGEAELLAWVTGLRVSDAEEEVVDAEEDVLLDDAVVEDLLEVVDEEAAFWTKLHLTVEDWLKFEGHY